MDDVFTAEDMASAAHYETLGPAYFAARRMAEALMQGAESEPLKAVAKKVTDDVRDAVYEYVETFLLGDLESNIQHHIQRLVDNTVQALLTGEPWALNQYALAKRFDGEQVRAAVAKHAGESLLTLRVEELEKELERVREALKWEREARSRY